MVARLVIFCIAVLGVPAFLILAYMRKVKRVEEAQAWPSAEATIQSGAIETIPNGRSSVDLPCFAFSYVVDGEYYSGRFGLLASGDRADDLVKTMVDRKLTVHYDPKHSATYFIPNSMIEGCEVKQKLSDMPFNLHPED